jgi:hypothetical protein
MYEITLCYSTTGDGPVRTRIAGRRKTIEGAQRCARRAAGAGATFVRKGMDSGYHGAAGLAWIVGR